MKPDFSGYATKAGLECSDGLTIMPDAFKHQDKMTVPLVWQHGHNEAANILGHANLENRADGMYSECFFNASPNGQAAKVAVQHGDITMLSIFANNLIKKGKQVFHGAIREVSLVIAGANPGAKIDFVSIAHSDGDIETLDDEAVIYTGLTITHADDSSATADDETVAEVYATLNDKQKNVVHAMIAAALEEGDNAAHSDTDEDTEVVDENSDDENSDDTNEGDLTHQEGSDMTRNVFEHHGAGSGTATARPTLTHDQLHSIVTDAQRMGSFKEAFLAHAVTYGIENIDMLFPDARTVDNSPEFVSRRMEWVSTVLGGAKKSRFARIKTISADITLDTARAKGYVKASLKKEEFFALSNRVTTPQTVYKKQKLDRDDIIDITDLDVVAWIKGEMRIMLDEEIARAALIGDGREFDDPDKINETNIRPIAFDDDFYTHKVNVAGNVTGDGLVDALVTNRQYYRGAGNPTMFTTETILASMLLVKDTTGRRIYPNVSDLMAAARVSNIVTVPVMEGISSNVGDIICILVNMSDYTFGADKGGEVSMFDDFDIDYNQFKYLIETRCSGTLTKFKSALVLTRTNLTLATPTVPTFVTSTGVLTVPAVTGVVYKNAATGATLSSGAQSAIAAGASISVDADPVSGYTFPHGFDEDWTFTRDA